MARWPGCGRVSCGTDGFAAVDDDDDDDDDGGGDDDDDDDDSKRCMDCFCNETVWRFVIINIIRFIFIFYYLF